MNATPMNRSDFITEIAHCYEALTVGNISPLEEYWTAIDMGKAIDKLQRLDRRTKYPPTNEITDDMIQSARDYDIRQLFEFQRGRTQCPFHNSKEPDLSYHAKSNRVHCFGSCGRSWNPIEVVMDRDGLSFAAAVRSLN